MKPGGGDQLATLLASADPTRGADVAKKCAICDNFEKAARTDRPLDGVLGRKIASHEGYEYSDALKSKSSEDWDYEKINHMIENRTRSRREPRWRCSRGCPTRSSVPM